MRSMFQNIFRYFIDGRKQDYNRNSRFTKPDIFEHEIETI